MKVLIVEDEQIAANKIINALNNIPITIELLGHFETVRDTVDCLRKQTPDLIFMDIELADGSSFEIFEQVKVECPVIFTTAYSQYAIKAFEVNSVDYLLKPITEEALEKALRNFRQMQKALSYDVLKSTLQEFQQQELHQYKSSFLVKSGNSLFPIPTSEIAYFYAEDKWTYLITTSSKQYILSYSLSQLETMLDPSAFQRINRSYFVQKKSIVRLEPYLKGKVAVFLTPEPKDSVIVSKKQTPVLKTWLGM